MVMMIMQGLRAELILFCPFLQLSQMVLTHSRCAGMHRSARGTAEVGASSGIGLTMPG